MAAAKTVDQEMDESLALAVEYLPLVVSGLARCRELGDRPLSHTESDIKAVGQHLLQIARGLTATICKADGGETLRSALAVRPPNEPEKPALVYPDIPPRGVEKPPPGTVFNLTRGCARDGWWYGQSKWFNIAEGLKCPSVKWIGRYEDDERVGYWEETTEDSNVLYGFYVGGKRDGDWTECICKSTALVITYDMGVVKSTTKVSTVRLGL